MSNLVCTRGSSLAEDAAVAVDEIASQIAQDDARAVIFFCSPSYDLERLASCLERRFTCAVVGCTSAGQIGPRGFQRGGVTAVALGADDLGVTPFLIEPLSGEPASLRRRVAEIAARVNGTRDVAGARS